MAFAIDDDTIFRANVSQADSPKIKIGKNYVSRVESNYKVNGRSHSIYHLIVVNKLSGKLSVYIRLFGLMA